MQKILDKKIPSLLGIFIIIIGIVSTTYLVKGDQLYQTYAGSGDEPKNIQITNVSDSSFTITYITDASVLGIVKKGSNPNNLDETFLDDRDRISQDVNNYKSHIITVNNLTSDTTYFFTIDSGNNTTTNNGSPFSVKTASKLGLPTSPQIALSGKTINPDGGLPTDGIIVMEINGAQKISTQLNKDGEYIIPLGSLRTSDLNSYFEIKDNSIINLKLNSSDYNSSVNISGNNISQVPTITLSNNYDFSDDETTSRVSVNSNNIKFPEFNSTPNIKSNPTNPSISIAPSRTPTTAPEQ